MVEARGLDVFLGRNQILHDVDFAATPGEITAIIGQNGSGKTTLLRALTGEAAFRGSVSVNGTPLSAYRPQDLARVRAVLPQSSSLSFPFTVREVVRLGASCAPAIRVARITEEALHAVGLDSFAGRLFQELSGGEQQRVHMARVLAQVCEPVGDAPRWLFLDEPVSSLDLKHQLSMMNVARSFAERGGGVISVLHDLNLAAMYADKIHAMHKGRTRAAGGVEVVLTDKILSDTFECRFETGQGRLPDTPFVLPQHVSLE